MNKQAELTRWSPKRLLSLLMALIMTLSLLPTAAFADDNPNEWYLDNFKTTGNEPESQVIVASGFFTGDARYELRINIDPNKTYMPGDRVSVKAIAQLFNVDNVNQPLKISISDQAYTANDTSDTLTVSYPFVGNSAIIVGKDGSISFNAGITYNVTVDGTTFADTKNVTVKIKNLWTGYNVTFTALPGAKFTGGIPKDGKAKTYARNAEAGDFTPVYKLRADMRAELDGYTFEGWNSNLFTDSLGNRKSVSLTAGTECEYDFASDATFTADLAKNQEITFDPGIYSGVTGLLNQVQYSQGTKYTITVQDPKLDGYQFTGWLQEGTSYIYHKGGTVAGITSATKLIAQWTPDDGSAPVGSHKVTFLAGAADAYIPFVATATVKDGTDYTIPTNKPTREGYEFKGWNDGTNTYQAGATISGVTKDIVLSAMWQQEMVTVTFPAADHLPAGVSYVATPASTPVAKGSNVTFRLKLAEGYDPATLHVFADGVALLGTPVNSYDVYYEYTVHNVMADTIIHVGPVTEKTFNVTLPTGAGFDAAFVVPAGTVPAGAADNKLTTVNYDGTVSFTVKARPGYTVEGVYANGVKLDPDTSTTDTYTIKNIKSNQAVMVDMAAVQFHTVTYVLDGAQMATQSVANGSNATSLSAPDKTGYTWDKKWYADEHYNTEFDFATPINENTVLYGHYTPNTFTISYEGLTETTSKTYGLAATLTVKQPTKEGHTFLGWSETDGATVASYLPGATFSKEIDHNITLHAVWQKNTYTITFSSGEGYSLHSIGSMTVAHGENFEFNLFVDPAYAQNTPTVYVNTGSINATHPKLISTSDAPTGDGAKVYLYRLENVKANTAINAEVTTNATYTVTFMTNGTTYQTQQVEFNHKATQPVDPVVEGYKFGGWYKESTCDNVWNFVDVPAEGSTPAIPADTVTKDTIIYAKLDPITPQITWPAAAEQVGYELKFTMPNALVTATGNTGTVNYKDVVTFTITILDGYDASKMQVGVNGVLLAPKSIVDNVYTYEFTAKENTEITVVGVERKTVTIIYNDNGGYGGPVQETVNYYLHSGPNDTISKTVPTREGYDFMGWSTDNNATWDATADKITHESGVTATDLQPGNESPFTSDTVLYAVWQAKETGITLEVSNTIDDTATLKAQYEGEDVTLTATIKSSGSGASVTTGSVQFYRSTDGGTNWTLLDSKVVSGGTAIYKAETSGFVYGGTNTDTYKAVFIPTEGNGYTKIETTTNPTVKVMSTAISWKLDATTVPTAPKIGADANELTIKDKTGTTVDSMVAGQVYTLELPAIYALDEQTNNLTVNKDYSVTWQYRNDKGVWTDYTNSGSGDTTKVDAAYSQYVFRAVVTPVTGTTSHFTKAAKYTTDGALVNDQYETMLISKPTTAVTLQTTKTDLVITGHNIEEDAGTVINGTAKFGKKHLAQFEGQTVILKATVIDSTSKNAVADGGKVYFYRYVDGKNDVKLNQTAIVVNNGIAELSDVIIKAYDASTGKYFNSDANIDRFYAVYEGDATYATSASVTYDASTGYAKPVSVAAATADSIFVKSTTIQTPIIDSTLPGKLNGADANSTSYEYDLTGLLAGVEHTFELRVGNDKADWSVVALDGRTVAAENYTIQWITKSGDNAETTAATDSKFKTSDNKVGDEIYVRLNPTGDMKTGADSKKAIIGTKQGVKVTVEAIDAIDKTPTAKDVYQLNEIELRATVTAADAKASMQPDGLVQFYYVDDNNFAEIGKPVSIQTVGGARYASIKTNQLPVTAVDNTKRDVKITAVYLGDTTFKASDNWQLKSGSTTEWEVTAADITDTVKSDTVTVYSSVVYAGDSENKATTTPSTDGITITANGALKANESSVTLTLGQVYTLDHDIPLSKLTYNTDYTVQWQILENALQHQDSGSAGSYASTTAWKDLSGQTGMNYTGTMEQDAAYRAVITVKDTPIAKGSFTKVDQAIKGRDVYYSNVLVVGAGMATVTTNITTSANQKFNEEGIVSGETATIHVLASGAAKTTPISTVTATITKSGATEPVFNEKANNVNGYTSFAWDTANLTPGYYTLTVTAESNNGYAPQTITRTLIVRDNAYTLSATTISKVYNGKAQGIDWELTGVDIEDALAQKSVVVYYYDKDGKMVEPTQAGEYQYDLYLPASAYWTELEHVSGTFTIEKRPVEVVDLVAQAKVYDGTNNANIQEIILNDSAVDSDGTATGDKGIIDGDSVYAVGTGYTSKDTAGTDATLGVKDVSLKGDDAANYTLSASGYTEVFNIQRSQVKGAIVSGRTYKYTGKDIKLAASDIYLIDQAGNQLTNYDVTYYYHNGDGVEKVDAMNKMGKYTVIARPEQNNYKGGATETVYVGNTDTPGTLNNGAKSSLITISNTVELYGARTGVTVSATKGTATASYYYDGAWKDTAPTNAGRYLVKATVTNDGVTDTAYGIYTIVKARPEFTPTTDKPIMEYTSGRYDGTVDAGLMSGSTAETYITYTGGTIQGVAYEAPTEVGKYIATVHVGETANYTAHEKQVAFEITPKALTITADDLQRWQYGSFPDMVASYQGLATKGIAADTSLRDVQIQPEFLFNEQNGGYTNHAFDQVGTYPVTVRNALARNYTVTYVGGTIATTAEEPKAELAIHGMPDNGTTTTENLVYYGDTIQLYAYGYYKTLDSNTSGGSYNTSSLIEWSVSDASIAEIDQSGLLTIKGVGTFTVTLTRGSGSAAISTTINVEAKPKEVSIDVPDVDKVYTASEQIYDSSPTVNGLINSDSVTPTVTAGTDKRTVVGSQITSYTVNDAKYVSETYGGLFTINVKNVSVTPNEISVIYGEALGTLGTPGTPGTLGYSENDTVVGVAALTDGKAVSERDAYINLDVLNGYEILVAGRENENYNVKYVTDQDAPDVEVTAKDLSISTGTLNSDGRTSGYLKDNDQFYMNEGFAITGTTFNLTPNDRMYGEVNPVMDYTFAGFVSGDSEADLVTLLPWLVKYSDGTYHNINGNANVAFDKTNHLNGFRATSFMSGMSAYPIDSMLLANSVKNYTLASTEATQNIYQRPVTLKLREGLTKLTAYKPEILGSSGSVTTEGKAKLLELLLNNLVVDKYNGEGGLAELLKHTIEDLNIQIDTISVSADKLTLTLKLGNQNYWLDSASSTIEIELVSTKIVPVYSPLDWTSFTVTMYNETKTSPVAISGNVRFFIFQEKDGVELKYSNYKNDTIIRSGLMDPTGRTGEFRATFSRLPAGDYAIFAIAENYTIVE